MSKFNQEVNSSVYQINMERVLLSSVFFNGYETLEMMIEKMIAEMFYLPAHQELYKVFIDLYKEDMPIDEEMVRTRTDRKKMDDSVLLEVLSCNPISNVKVYVDTVIENFKRREIEKVSIYIKKMFHEECLDSESMLTALNRQIIAIENHDSKHRDIKFGKEWKEEFKNRPKIEKLPTYVVWIDSTLDGGIKLGNFVFWSGKKETGKTTMAIQIHENMAMNGHKVGVLPLEFGTQHYLESLDERYPHSDNHKKVAILENMALEDRFNDIADIEKTLRDFHKKGIKSVLVDSQLRLTNAGMANTTKAERTADIFSRIGIIAQKLLMTVHIIVQTSKADHDSEEISVKGCIDADHEASIWFHLKKQKSNELRDVVIAKNKQNSKRPLVTVKFNPVTKEFKKVNDETKEGIPVIYEQSKNPKVSEFNGGNDPVLPKDQNIDEDMFSSILN